jgi:hypothetical protein
MRHRSICTHSAIRRTPCEHWDCPRSSKPLPHTGRHDCPSWRIAAQPDPRKPFSGGRFSQALQHAERWIPSPRFQQTAGAFKALQHSSHFRCRKQPGGAVPLAQACVCDRHVAAVSVPASQAEGPDATKPGAHCGWHVSPLLRIAEQSPRFPFLGGVLASHGAALHVAGVSWPFMQAEGQSEGSKPASHAGRHVPPLAKAAGQFPGCANRGGTLVLHHSRTSVEGAAVGATETYAMTLTVSPIVQ